MSQQILNEATFFFHSFLLGILITVIYDGWIICRRLIPHNRLAVSFEDFLFWSVCAIGTFNMLYEENNGILRWFAVLAAVLGMLIYKKTISKLIINIMSTIIGHIIDIAIHIVRIITKPIFCIIRKVFTKLKKIKRIMKLRLTKGMKTIKITLCKH